jgi:hypothetical protein
MANLLLLLYAILLFKPKTHKNPNLKRDLFYPSKTDFFIKNGLMDFQDLKRVSKMSERKGQSVVFRKVIVESCDYTYEEFMRDFDKGDYTKKQLNILWDKLFKKYDDVKEDPLAWIKETNYTIIEEEHLTESGVIQLLDNWQETDKIIDLRFPIHSTLPEL